MNKKVVKPKTPRKPIVGFGVFRRGILMTCKCHPSRGEAYVIYKKKPKEVGEVMPVLIKLMALPKKK